MNEALQRKNKRLIIILIGAAIGMFGFGFALVPIYRVVIFLTPLIILLLILSLLLIVYRLPLVEVKTAMR